MRIAVFVPSFPSMSETFVLNQVTGLIDRGHEVTVLAYREGVSVRDEHAVVKQYNLRAHTIYLGYLPADPWGRVSRVAGLFFATYRRPVLQVLRSLNVFRHGRDAFSLRLAYYTLRLSQLRRGFDAILCQYGPTGLIAHRLGEIGALRGPRAVVFHGFDLSRLLRIEGRRAYDPLLRSPARLLPISRFFRRRLIELGAIPARITVHHMGVDVKRLAYRERAFPSDGRWRFLTIGRLAEKKGMKYAILALARVSGSLPGCRLDIVGDGPLRPQFETLIDKLGLGDRVQLHGWMQHDEVASMLARAHVLIAPSVTAADGNTEGIPVVLMEALATGLPVISTRHSGIPELISDRETGFLVDERDVEGLSDAIRHATGNPGSLAEITRRGRELVEAEFNIDRLNDRLVELLAGLRG
ncbi:MAG: Alpha-D-kanosaminyltransferase [Calditrichaeota bacterium]|nr:Alpha-D-kanosaminyltransferase [Calditrichota bacterium]